MISTKRFRNLSLAALCAVVTPTFADVEINLIDTGSGFASITKMSDGSYMMYDTGHWHLKNKIVPILKNIMGDKQAIELMVVSHSDADHLGGTANIMKELDVKTVLRTGKQRTSGSWRRHDEAIRTATQEGNTRDFNYANSGIKHGTIIKAGDTKLHVLSGFHNPPESWPVSGSEALNATSVVIRLEYKGRSVLFTGDAVGRHEGSDDASPAIATERYLIDRMDTSPIASDVMFVPHHGGDDASSAEFIQKVSPSMAIFSAGSMHEHPRSKVAGRYMDAGLAPSCLLRTDLGDNEGDDEWSYGNTPEGDTKLDDGIKIVIKDDGTIHVSQSGISVDGCFSQG